jgi:hypothetical protein
MRDLNQDFVIKKLEADLRKPVDPGHLSVHGSGSLHTVDLGLDAVVIQWGEDRVVLTGEWPRVGRGVVAVDLAVERLDLAHLKVFSEKIPLASVVRGDLRIDGPLSDFHVKGGLDVEGGGHLQIRDAAVRIARGKPLGHAVDLDLEAFPLRSVVTVEALPRQLTGRLQWDGEGTKLPTLKGELSADLLGFRYREFHVEPTTLRAGIEDSVLRIDRLDTGTDGLTVRSSGDVDLDEGRFTLDTDMSVWDLSGLGSALRLPLAGGSVELSGRQIGSWKSPGSPFVLHTDSKISGRVIALGGLGFDGIDGDWTLEVALDRKSVV